MSTLEKFNAWFMASDLPGTHIESAWAAWSEAQILTGVADPIAAQVHIDLETLDTAHTAQILSIGAVCGDSTYYAEVALDGYPPTAGFTQSKDTVEWWAARGGFKPSQEPVFPYEAISGLIRWYDTVTAGNPDITVWANSPSFDCAILNHHFAHWGLQAPWLFYQERDVRTVKDLAKTMRLNIKMPENPHNALKDACNQRDLTASVYYTLADKVQRARDSAMAHPGIEYGRGE